MSDFEDVRADLLPTPWVGSWVGRARAGDLHDREHGRRAAAWAHWAVEQLGAFTGVHDRSYYALRLPARFYDPRGTGPQVRPHLEVSSRVLQRVDPSFPDRLALAGNGILFPWWVKSEVTALRRVLFNTAGGSIGDLLELLSERRESLQKALVDLSSNARPHWDTIENLLVSAPDGLSEAAACNFSAEEVAAYFPPADKLGIEVRYDAKLRDVNGVWAARRVGMWQVVGVNDAGERFELGVTTPRLTAGSLFKDPLFDPGSEALAALLVRGLVLRRLTATYLPAADVKVSNRRDRASLTGPGRPHLRAVPARVGAKLPQAGVDAAVRFLQEIPNATDAWTALTDWAGSGYLLTVSEEAFRASHRNCRRYVRRAETPSRDDIDVILPLAWDVSSDTSRVVRVTFSAPADRS